MTLSPKPIVWKSFWFASLLGSFVTIINGIQRYSTVAERDIPNAPTYNAKEDIFRKVEIEEKSPIHENTTITTLGPLEWSDFPTKTTPFTDHVLKIVKNLNKTLTTRCGNHINLTSTTTSGATPTTQVTCSKGEHLWCAWFNRTFSYRAALPYNVTIGLALSDSFHPKPNGLEGCLGNSSPKGRFCIINSEEISEHNRVAKRCKLNNCTNDELKWPYRDDVPWESRSPVPIFRGSPRGYQYYSFCKSRPNISYVNLLAKVKGRYAAVDLSVDHPYLLDARFASFTNKGCFLHAETNGLSKLLPSNQISPPLYYSQYQVALVLGGAGAAYRTARHLQSRTAIVLQAFEYEEWFTPYMKAWVHYIPLQEDMSDLKAQMEWIQQNPSKVKEIAQQGHEFYKTFLTFSANEDHMYELVYRLSEYFEKKRA